MLNEPTEGKRHGSYRVNPTEKLPGLSKDAELAGTPRYQTALEDVDEMNGTKAPALARFRKFLSQSCCCDFVDKVPVILIGIAIAIVIILLLCLIPVILVLTSGVASETQAQTAHGVDLTLRNAPHGIAVSDDELDKSDEGSGIDAFQHAISMTALIPSNVSVCTGFGFFCANEPHIMVSTDRRCDGYNDCSDGSDELNCQECQTPHSCSLSSNSSDSRRICLRPSQLCDGVRQCPDGSDEAEEYCGPDCNEDEQLRCDHIFGGLPFCLPSNARCDGIMDCKGGIDEIDCAECSGAAKMCSPTNECIDARRTCDGSIDCPDGSDEQGCDCRACCGNDRALCGDGTCINRDQVCDGIVDCLDGFDEMDCPGNCKVPSLAQHFESTVLCTDGKRYLQSEACSGSIEACYSSCKGTCDELLTFTCSDGSCIPKSKVCDGIADCRDIDDESDCTKECEKDDQFFRCSSSSEKCISVSQRCDGVWDCENGSDEYNCDECPTESIRCEHDNSCFPLTARCDGFPDCSDGSDETNCTCDECTGRHSFTYMCEGSNRCFRRDEVCSPYSLCPNETVSDKLFCAGMALKGFH